MTPESDILFMSGTAIAAHEGVRRFPAKMAGGLVRCELWRCRLPVKKAVERKRMKGQRVKTALLGQFERAEF